MSLNAFKIAALTVSHTTLLLSCVVFGIIWGAVAAIFHNLDRTRTA